MFPLTLPCFNSLRLAEVVYRLQLRTRLVLCSSTDGPPGPLEDLFDSYIPASQLSVASLRRAFSSKISRGMSDRPLDKIEKILNAGYLVQWANAYDRYLDFTDVLHNRALRNRASALADRENAIAKKVCIKTAWPNGSFYLFAAVVIVVLLASVSALIPWYSAPLVFTAGILIIVVIGAFQLRNDGAFTERGFLKLLIESLKRIPLLNRQRKSDRDQ